MATHSSILAWRIPWTEEPGGLQSVGSQSRIQVKGPNAHIRTRSPKIPGLFPLSAFVTDHPNM